MATCLVVSAMHPERPDPAEDQQIFLESERLWHVAHAIVADNPALDAGDVYHALRCLELSPAERLRRGLTRVRDSSHAR